jgi:hypothetical protein
MTNGPAGRIEMKNWLAIAPVFSYKLAVVYTLAAKTMKSGRIKGLNPISASSCGARAAFPIILALWIVCFGFAQFANAEVRISGAADALKIETQQASLDEVLRALRASFKFQYHSTEALKGVISGTYSGSLRGVVTRLLEGNDYVIHDTKNNLEVAIFGPTITPASNQANGAVPAQMQPEPSKECQYKDGDRIIPVEC